MPLTYTISSLVAATSYGEGATATRIPPSARAAGTPPFLVIPVKNSGLSSRNSNITIMLYNSAEDHARLFNELFPTSHHCVPVSGLNHDTGGSEISPPEPSTPHVDESQVVREY